MPVTLPEVIVVCPFAVRLPVIVALLPPEIVGGSSAHPVRENITSYCCIVSKDYIITTVNSAFNPESSLEFKLSGL